MSTNSVEVKTALRKGVQDSEVSPLEYVQSKIAQCLHDEPGESKQGQGNLQGQPGTPAEIQQPGRGRSPHPQVS